EDRLIGGVARLELPGFAVQHRSDPLDDALAEQALRPEQQEDESQHIGEPVLDGAAEGGAPEHLGDLLAGADDEAADDGAGDRGETAEDEDGQRLQGDQRERELHAEAAAPHDAGDEADDAGDRPDDDPDGLQRDADAERRLMIVGDRAQGAADAGLLEEEGEAGDEDAGDGGGDEVELVDQDAADDDRVLGDADVEHLDVAAPDELAEAAEEEGDADRRHEQDDGFLVDQRAQHDALDDEGERHHHRDRRQEGEPYRHAEIDEADEGERREQDHDALGEIEDARRLVDQHEAEGDERVHDAGQEPADDHLEEELGVVGDAGEGRDEDRLEEIHALSAPRSCPSPLVGEGGTHRAAMGG